MPVPTKPSIRQTRRARVPRDIGLFVLGSGLVWPLIKIGFMILAAIAVVVLVGWLLFKFILVTMPMSLIALVIMGLIIWLIVKHS
jgi:hypothetical protein